jgi:hypothetical protein
MSEIKKSLREKIADLLKTHNVKLSVTKVEMSVTGKLDDGTEIASPSSAFEVGAEVYVMDAEGNEVPAPDGEHVIDGTLKITAVGGKIETVEVVEMKNEEELSAEVSEIISDLGKRIADLEAKSASAATELAAEKAKADAAQAKVTELSAQVADLSKAKAAFSVKGKPATEKVELKKDEQKKTWAQMNSTERIKNAELNPRFKN